LPFVGILGHGQENLLDAHGLLAFVIVAMLLIIGADLIVRNHDLGPDFAPDQFRLHQMIPEIPPVLFQRRAFLGEGSDKILHPHLALRQSVPDCLVDLLILQGDPGLAGLLPDEEPVDHPVEHVRARLRKKPLYILSLVGCRGPLANDVQFFIEVGERDHFIVDDGDDSIDNRRAGRRRKRPEKKKKGG